MPRTPTPFGICTAAGGALISAACLVDALVPRPDAGWRLLILAAVVTCFAAAVVDVLAVVAVVCAAFLLFDGFLVGSEGDLVWRGEADVVRLAVLTGAGLLGATLGALRRWARTERRLAPLESSTTSPRSRSR